MRAVPLQKPELPELTLTYRSLCLSTLSISDAQIAAKSCGEEEEDGGGEEGEESASIHVSIKSISVQMILTNVDYLSMKLTRLITSIPGIKLL